MFIIRRYAVFSMLLGLFAPLHAGAQAKAAPSGTPSTYEVKRGDSVLALAGRIRYPKASVNQMAYAIIHANLNALGQRTTETWRPGATLKIPDEAAVLAVDPKTADAYIARRQIRCALPARQWRWRRRGRCRPRSPPTSTRRRSAMCSPTFASASSTTRTFRSTLPHDLQESIKHYQKARERGLTVEGADRIGIGEIVR